MSWAKFCCDVFALPYPEAAHQFERGTYDRSGNYIGQRLTLTAEEQEWMDGFLLGDGSISLDERNPKRPSCAFRLSSKHYSMACFAHDMLPSLKGSVHTRIDPLTYTAKGEERTVRCPKAIYYSCSWPELRAVEKRWYAPGSPRTKRVPLDLQLTPRILNAWFLGDGGIGYSRHDRGILTLATHCFEHGEVQRLAAQLRQLGVNCAVDSVWGTTDQFQIRIPSSQAPAFLELIGPCPVPELGHRWKLTRAG